MRSRYINPDQVITNTTYIPSFVELYQRSSLGGSQPYRSWTSIQPKIRRDLTRYYLVFTWFGNSREQAPASSNQSYSLGMTISFSHDTFRNRSKRFGLNTYSIRRPSRSRNQAEILEVNSYRRTNHIHLIPKWQVCEMLVTKSPYYLCSSPS